MELSNLLVLRFIDIHNIEVVDFDEAKRLNPGLTINQNKWYHFMNSHYLESNQIGKKREHENRWGIIGVYDSSNPEHLKSLADDKEFFSKEREVIDLSY